MKTIQTDKAPAAIGPYSQAIADGNFIFCSGQIGLDPKTGTLVEGLEYQAHQALTNLEEVLAEAGAKMSDVIKTTVFIKNIIDFPQVNEIYAKHFGEHKPARSTVGVADLPKGALVEVEAVAIKH